MQRSRTTSANKRPAACIRSPDKKGKGEDKKEKVADGENGTPLKKPAAKITPKAKSSPETTPKAKAKAKSKAKAKGKAKSSPKKGTEKDKKGEKAKEDEGDQVFSTPKRKLFQSDSDPDEASEIAEKPKDKEKNRRNAKPEPKKTAKGKAKAKAKAKSKSEKKEDEIENKPAKKPRRTRRKDDGDAPAEGKNLGDDVMKGLFIQVLKDTKTMVIEDMKKYLAGRKPTLSSGNVGLNVYWTKAASACRLLCVGTPSPDAAYFSFKQGTWNMRMASAFMASVLMAPWRMLGLGGGDGGVSSVTVLTSTVILLNPS